MPYVIANESFDTKQQLAERCREIVSSTPDGTLVQERDLPFLLELLRHHDEWEEKSCGGVQSVTTQTTAQGTRCFTLVREAGPIDISFHHAIRQIPSSRAATIIPQGLRDFRAAARNAVSAQVWSFRDRQLVYSPSCPITGVELRRDNCAVDHSPPATFDVILFAFCQARMVNPLSVAVGSLGGTVAAFEDHVLLGEWQAYHQKQACLRLVSKIGNLQLPKVTVDWGLLSS